MVSIVDANNDPVYWEEIPAGTGFKNISIYENDKTATAEGIWTISCQSPNKITSFAVVDKDDVITWEYYPGYNNRSRIKFSTGQMHSDDANISLFYLYPDGSPVMTPDYYNSSILPNTDYTGSGSTPYWNIPITAEASSNYVAMVKWIDNGSGFVDEIGYAAHYIQIKRNITIGSINFNHGGDTSNYVITGEQLDISINIIDPLLAFFQEFDEANITFFYPLKSNPFQIGNTTLSLTKELNTYVYHLDTDGDGEPGQWPVTNAWMGMTGNITFRINLYAESTFLNGHYEYYSLSGWFHNIVDVKYESIDLTNADDPKKGSVQEQGSYLLLNVSLEDQTYGHQDAKTQIPGGSLINNRTFGTPIPDLYPPYPQPRDGIADTWNGTVRIQWAIIEDNLSSWTGPSGNPNLEEYKWNGTLTQIEGEPNLYSAMIKIPNDAYISETHGTYYMNVTTTFLENEWGWMVKPLSTVLSFTVEEAKGFETDIDRDPDIEPTYWWKNSSRGLTRLWIRYYNSTNGFGFNSTFLNNVESWYVKSYALGYFSGVPEEIFGRSWNPIYWNHCKAGTLMPDGVTPDPHAEDPHNNNTWGWFYHDFNWTKIKLPLASFDNPPTDQEIQIGITADITNETEYQKKSVTFVVHIKPNSVELNVLLKYEGNPTFLDENYYGIENMTQKYYWGDILNFTVSANDQIENTTVSDILLRYRLQKTLSSFTITGWVNETNQQGVYTGILNTSDPNLGLTAGTYDLWIEGIKQNYSINVLHDLIVLNERDTRLRPEKIAGVFLDSAVADYGRLGEILDINKGKGFDPRETYRTVPNQTLYINVSLFDNSPRNGGDILDANIRWVLKKGVEIRLSGWVNTSVNGIFCITIDLHNFSFDISEYESKFSLVIIPYKYNYESDDDEGYPGGSYWDFEIRIGYRPIALIPITPISMSYSQSNWKWHPIRFAAMDLISRENISGVRVDWRIIGTDLSGIWMEEYAPGYYQVVFDTWPSLFSWIKEGIYRLEAEIVFVPGGNYGITTTPDWYGIPNLHGSNGIILVVESEGFLGPLSVYFYIILGVVGAVIGAYYSYKSYKFLTTPYVIRKIEESIDKISKDKKVAAGVMKSRDHLIFLEATELLRVVGVALKPPPEKKLPPPIEKVAKIPEEKVEKLPEIPIDIISAELDKAGVRPEEKPILMQQIAELDPLDKKEFLESLIGEERFKELIEELKTKQELKPQTKKKK